MRWHDPLWLLLLPVALVAVWRSVRRSGSRIKYPTVTFIRGLPGVSLEPKYWLAALRAAALIGVIVALARPQSGKQHTEVTSPGVDILLALDLSGSMRGLDMKLDGKPVERAEVVKRVAGDFIRKRSADRVGLVVFGETAFLQCPLTRDQDLLKNFLEAVHVGIAGDSTAIGDAIGVGVNHLKKLKAKSRVLVLLTDGSSNSGVLPPEKGAELAAHYGIKIYTIGVGADGRVPFRVDGPLGPQIQYGQADLDEPTLKEIAETTGGKYFRARDTEALLGVYDEIDRLEKTDVKTKEYHEYHERFAWALLPALLLLLTEIGLAHTVWRRIP